MTYMLKCTVRLYPRVGTAAPAAPGRIRHVDVSREHAGVVIVAASPSAGFIFMRALFVRTVELACCVTAAAAAVHTLPGNSPLIRCEHHAVRACLKPPPEGESSLGFRLLNH